jgi:hypothetical protein
MHEKSSFSHYGVPFGTEVSLPQHSTEVSEAISREAGERDLAMLRAMNPPTFEASTKPSIREPELPADFASNAARLDREIVDRGIAVDREKLLALGKERFARLLEADRLARDEQRVFGTRTDFTRFESVQFALAGAFAAAIPRRRHAEILSGHGADREAAAQISSFNDLWKLASEPRAVRAVHQFRDEFESLVFARSLLEQIGDDNRVRSRFFVGGSGRKVALFSDWLAVLEPLVSVTVRGALFSIVSWLANEKQPSVGVLQLAQEISGARVPRLHEIRLAQALFSGFLLGYDGWELWDYVGSRTRCAPDFEALVHWRKVLSKRFRAIGDFHAELASRFYRDIGTREGAHRQLDATAHQRFVDQTVNGCLNVVSALVAIAATDAQPVARFQNSILLEGKTPKFLQARIESELATAFPSSTFSVAISEDVSAK